VVANEAYVDGMTIARQLGVLPPTDSGAERGLTALTNLRTRLARRIAAGDPEPIADGVWVVRGGFPGRIMNVYLLRDGDGVLLFDAGVQSMTPALAAIGAQMGGITRIVLGHGHADHRGAAPGLGAPVWCHPDEVADAEGDGGMHYFDLTALDAPGKLLLRRLLPIWDAGPVSIAGTVSEGDEVAGFRAIHLPGHAPGLIGLWRDSDRLALVSDCFYTLNPQTGIPGAPRVPHRAFNKDNEQARASMRKLAALAPATAWCGHAEPLRGDVAGQLERAATTT
jgi:hydroxyacylglutathione hydrolase